MQLKRIAALLCTAVTLIASMCGCSGGVKTVSDLAYDLTGEVGIVYVQENGQYTPFLVLTNDYGGNTLLLRQDVLPDDMRINEYSALYTDSEIDTYLNNAYLGSLSGVSIVDSDIEATRDESLGACGTKTETISRKVFLLSCEEVGISSENNMAAEGTMLAYFQNAENRTAYRDGEQVSWWLRSPNTYYISCTYVLGANDKIGSTNAYDSNSIRPAFCVSGDAKIERKSGIVDEQEVYVFSEN